MIFAPIASRLLFVPCNSKPIHVRSCPASLRSNTGVPSRHVKIASESPSLSKSPTARPRARYAERNTIPARSWVRSEEHTSELQSQSNLVCRLLLEKKKKSHRLILDAIYVGLGNKETKPMVRGPYSAHNNAVRCAQLDSSTDTH